MFILYESNDFNVLKHVMLDVLEKIYLNDIFVKKTILIPNSNLAFFLKKYIAKKLGICANYNFVLPAKFMWNILKLIFSNIYEKDYLDKNNLIWVIMTLLPDLIDLKEFQVIKNYLNKDYNFEKLYFLSFKIADLYDKYLVYRIDLLNSWENFKVSNINNIHQLWQSILWKKIIKYYKNKYGYFVNRSNFYFKFIELLKKDILSKVNDLPLNIFIFNVSFLPPMYVDFFFSISKQINVHYFIVNPSFNYWYDKNYFYEFYKNIYDFSNERFFKNINNKYSFLNKNLNLMLLNCGKIFADYLNIINNYDNFINIKSFVVKNNSTLLNKIQNNILYFKENNFFSQKKNICKDNIIFENDNSVSINSCYGYLREVEILQDFILNLIINNNYTVDDIIVVVSDIYIYYPYIKGVFSNSNCRKFLPFHIMEDENYLNNKIFDVFMQLLNLRNIDFTFDNMMFFLKNNFILEKFDINLNDLEIIKNIINDVGICSGINNFSVKFSIDDYNFFTWDNGIKRILLSYAINNNFCIWNNIVPYVNIGDNFFNDILSKLTNFIHKLMYWKNVFKKKYVFKSWLLICQNLLNDFFIESYVNRCDFLHKDKWSKINYSYKFGNFNRKIGSNLFTKIIINFLKKKRSLNKYSIGHINFGSFVSLKSIPFKVICLIGMNSDLFPRNLYFHDFDLMYLYPRIGDRNKRENDKYIFLESLISAKEKFYISYINYSLSKNEKCYPSLLVDNLLDYININFFCNEKNINHIVFKDKFCVLHNKYVFDIKNFVCLDNYVSHQYEWFFDYKVNLNNDNFKIKNDLNLIFFKKKFNIFIEEIYLFWFHPIKYFFQKFLKMNFYIKNTFCGKEEVFNLNKRDFYLTRLKLIFYYIKNKNIDDDKMIFYLQSLNLLPINFFGNVVWKNEKKKIKKLIYNIHNIVLNLNLLKFDFVVDGINIFGCIYLGNGIGVFKFLPKNITLTDCFSFWINHLIYCFLGGDKKSYIYGYNGCWSFNSFTKQKSEKLLIKYLLGYFNGINNPLFFFPKSSNMWILSAYNLQNKTILTNNYLLKSAKYKLLNVMYGNNYYNGELNDIYFFRLINYLNKSIKLFDVIKQAEKWLFPIFKYLIFNN